MKKILNILKKLFKVIKEEEIKKKCKINNQLLILTNKNITKNNKMYSINTYKQRKNQYFKEHEYKMMIF